MCSTPRRQIASENGDGEGDGHGSDVRLKDPKWHANKSDGGAGAEWPLNMPSLTVALHKIDANDLK